MSGSGDRDAGSDSREMSSNAFALAHWRRSVAELYAQVRRPAADPSEQCEAFRRGRDTLFRTHPESPIAEHLRSAWPGVQWFPYDPAARVDALVQPAAERATFEIALAADGMLRCTRAGDAHFVLAGHRASLALYWLEGYGGGLWLPFADATTGVLTYGGGRYLYDTIKGADLGVDEHVDRARLQLRVSPVVRLRRALVVPARAAGKPPGICGRGRRASRVAHSRGARVCARAIP